MQRAKCCVLGTGCCMLGAAAGLAPAPTFRTVPADYWSPLLRLPAPGCCALKSAPETPLLSHPRPARDQPRTTPVCSCALCRWLGSSSNEQGEAIFWADLQKISTRGVISMLEHHSYALPTLPLPFTKDLIFQGEQMPTARCSSRGPTCVAGVALWEGTDLEA